MSTQSLGGHGVTTSINRDDGGLVLSVKHGNYTRTYNYDEHHHLTQDVEPEFGVIHYGQDLLGHMTSKQFNSDPAIQYVYNDDGELAHTIYPDTTSSTDRNYDADDRLININSPSVQWHYQYDYDGNMTSMTANTGNGTYKFTNTFDVYDHLLWTTYPNGTSLVYNPNSFGEPTTIGSEITGIRYTPSGRVSNYLDATGNGVNRTYSDYFNVLNYVGAGGSAMVVRAYGGPNLASKEVPAISISQGQNSGVENFTYDPDDQLISGTGTLLGNLSFAYDIDNNLIAKTEGSTQTTYHYDNSNKLQNLTVNNQNSNVTYDYRGNMTQYFNNTLTYNSNNQVTSITNPIANSTDTFAYDGFGNRTISTHNGRPTFEFHQGSNLLFSMAADNPADMSNSTIYLHLGGQLIGEVKTINGAPDTVFYYNDTLGSPIASSDTKSGSALIWTQTYEPYGQEITDLSQQRPNTHVGFTGKLNNSDTDLTDMGARLYSPELGRFTSTDPVDLQIENPLRYNRYAYVLNNPYRYTDPTGALPDPVEAIAGGILGGALLDIHKREV